MSGWPALFKACQAECMTCHTDDLTPGEAKKRFVEYGRELLGCMQIGRFQVSLEDRSTAGHNLRILSSMALDILSQVPGGDTVSRCRDRAYLLFVAKNRDYGDAFVNYGVVGIMVRLGDKFSRVESLWSDGRDPAVVSESVLDTLIDIHNYCTMVLMVMNKTS